MCTGSPLHHWPRTLGWRGKGRRGRRRWLIRGALNLSQMIGILRLPLGPCSYSWYLPGHRRVLSGCLPVPRCVCNWHFQKLRVPKFTASSFPRAAMPRPRTERGAASPATGMAPAARPWAVGAATVRRPPRAGRRPMKPAVPGHLSGACGYRLNGPVGGRSQSPMPKHLKLLCSSYCWCHIS